ncbi:MAG TPA: M18 family aminopeptidase, partial [Geodermatophilus sp.]|nr:M18 family aminopeptidase [Geodermatophilus sp.]
MPDLTPGLSPGDDLRALVDASPSPFHAVAELARRLTAAGFSELAEADAWSLAPGDARFVVRSGSLLAFRVGSAPFAGAGMRLVGAHTDSPTFRVRPRPDVRQAGYRLVGVEPYGGGLWHTWLDRELTAAGRVALRGGRTALVALSGAPLRLPSLAIHLDRGVRE